MRTIFNVLGPMTNPAGVKHMLIGVVDAALCKPVAEVLGRLGAQHAVVVHADDGLDEISLAAPSQVAEWHQGELREYRVTPQKLGITSQSTAGLEVDGAESSLALVRAALSGSDEPLARRAADLLALNAGAALYAADLAGSMPAGVQQAQAVLASGAALHKLEQLAELTRSF
jgi:anthranilate phosphoribosyltransferase